MRKALLFLLSIPVGLMAQNLEKVERQSNSGLDKAARTEISPVFIQNTTEPIASRKSARRDNWFYSSVVLGESRYDLQVNSSLARRVRQYEGGKMSVVFTRSSSNQPFDDRGTGYQHFDGSKWFEPIEDGRIEDDRAGWATIGTVQKGGNTVEYVLSHYANNNTDQDAPSGGLFINMNDGIGSTNWTQTTFNKGNDGPWWPRSIGKGKYIHVIATHNNDTNLNRNGMNFPILYYRFDAEAGEFVDTAVALPNYDNTVYEFGTSDAYSIDANDEKIVVAMGTSRGPIQMWESTDDGVTWKNFQITEFYNPLLEGEALPYDDTERMTAGTSVHIALDGDGYSHVFCDTSVSFYSNTEGPEPGWYFSPGLNGIMYWNNKPLVDNDDTTIYRGFKVIGGAVDENQNFVLDFTAKQTEVEGGARYSNNTLASFPSSAFDEQGNMYVVYSAPVEGEKAQSPNTASYRDLYVVFSTDSGKTWADPQNLTQSFNTEDVFGVAAKMVTDGKLHVVWQRDELAGTVLTNEHEPTTNEILYATWDTEVILGERLSVEESRRKTDAFIINSNYPNPFSGITTFDLTMVKSERVNIEVMDLTGRQVTRVSYGTLAPGNAQINLDATGWPAGVYVYRINAGESTVAGKLTVE